MAYGCCFIKAFAIVCPGSIIKPTLAYMRNHSCCRVSLLTWHHMACGCCCRKAFAIVLKCCGLHTGSDSAMAERLFRNSGPLYIIAYAM